MATDQTAYQRRAALAQLDRFQAMAERRFRDETLAGEAVNYVLAELQADDWRRVRAYRGPARLETYLVTVAARLLEDFARRRFGRARVPDWVRARGALWELLYRLLCLERQPLAAALAVVAGTAPGGRDPAHCEEAAFGIRARYPHCGEPGPGEVPVEDIEDLAAGADTDPWLAVPATPEHLALETEREGLLRTLSTRLLGTHADDGPAQAATPVDLPPITLSTEERLLLRLVYADGLKVADAGATLGLGVHQTHGRLRRLLARLRRWLAVAGIDFDPQDLA